MARDPKRRPVRTSPEGVPDVPSMARGVDALSRPSALQILEAVCAELNVKVWQAFVNGRGREHVLPPPSASPSGPHKTRAGIPLTTEGKALYRAWRSRLKRNSALRVDNDLEVAIRTISEGAEDPVRVRS